MAALAGYKAAFYYTSTGVTITSGSPSVYTDSGDHQNYAAPSAKRYLDDSVAVTLQTSPDGTTWTTQSASLYTLTFVGGAVKFGTAQASGTQVRLISGSYLPYAFMGDAKTIEVNPQVDVQDATAFQNPPSAWRTKLATLVGADVKCSKWWVDTTWGPLITNASRLVIAAYSGANANQRLEGYARMKTSSVKIAVDKLIEQDLDFTIDGQLYWTPS